VSRARGRRALPALLLVVFASVASAEPGTISPDELARRIEAGDAPLVLDVRTVQEFRDGHIPGAVNVPVHELASRIDEIAEYREQEVVVHCRSGRRARNADAVLEEAG
jgi:rhodanese-related sulfurtransferase